MSTPLALESDPRTADQIEADMAQARERLSRNVAALQEAASPEAMQARAMTKVRGFFFDEFGGIRPERVAIAAGVVFLFIGGRRKRR